MASASRWLIVTAWWIVASCPADEPPAINPFKPRVTAREDAIQGFVELSDGSIHPGAIYLTRDLRLKIFDSTIRRQREIPLHAITRIDCHTTRQWMEREWRFKANANNEKVYTGRRYPAREYVHTITLHGGRTIKGPVSAIIYVQSEKDTKPRKLLLHKRHKGPLDSELKSLVFVRAVRLGEEQYEEGLRLAEQQRKKSNRTKKK